MKIYIAPPFGTYFRPKGAIPVLGSFTPRPRPGRTGQVLRTVRPVPGGWVNAIGLRNPGVGALRCRYQPGIVYSLAGIEDGDWSLLYHALWTFQWPAYDLELNLSCPNVHEYGPPTRGELEAFTTLPNAHISAKLPPDLPAAIELTARCLEAGIRLIHLSNTLPSPVGGVSGAPLRKVNLPIVAEIARRYPQAEVIAGGGIYNESHARAYLHTGAKHLSLGTVWMNPLRGWRLYRRLR
jgi:dihydroorotate dehydrogenase